MKEDNWSSLLCIDLEEEFEEELDELGERWRKRGLNIVKLSVEYGAEHEDTPLQKW